MKHLLIIISVLLLVGAAVAPVAAESLDPLHPRLSGDTSNSLSPGPAYWNGGHEAAKSGVVILATPPVPMFTSSGIRPGVFFLTLPRGSSASHEAKPAKEGRQAKSR